MEEQQTTMAIVTPEPPARKRRSRKAHRVHDFAEGFQAYEDLTAKKVVLVFVRREAYAGSKAKDAYVVTFGKNVNDGKLIYDESKGRFGVVSGNVVRMDAEKLTDTKLYRRLF